MLFDFGTNANTMALQVSPSNNTDTDSAATPAPTSDAYPIPPIPKAYLTQEMKDQRPNITNIDSNLSDIDKQLVKYCAELKSLNHALKLKIANLVEIADWSSLTKWHAKETKELMAKIKETKQERARLNGVTGAESALSSKRKATDDAEQTRHTATPKKARAFAPSQESAVSYTPKADPPASNTAQKSTSFGFTPTATPASKDTSQTSNLFGNILSKPTNSPLFPSAPTTDSPKAASSPFGSSQPAAAPSSAKPSVSESAAGFKPSTPSGFQPSVAKDSPAPSGSKPSGFQPSTTKDRPASSGFKPSGFQASSSVSGSSMVNAFAQQAKSAEQLAAERKKKAKDEEYDSDEETYEEWSARYDREQAAKKEEEAKKPQTTQAFKGFSLSTAASTASSPFNASRNASGTTSIFTSGAASPAHSANGGLSVFDTPSAAPSPGSNIFGHLSSNASSNNQDDSDEEEQDEEEEEEGKAGQSKDGDATAKDDTQASKPSLFSRISYGPPAGQAEDEDASAKDDTKTSKPSLLSRITRDPPAAEASNADVNATVETPKNKFQFDFANAGAKTAPPKPSTFAGDQTWKPGTKINFGSSISDAGTANMPLFNLQPATPSSSGAGTKAVPFSLFSNSAGAPSKPSFLAPGAAQSGPGSVASSVFSSRATTPLSDAGASDPGAADDETPSGPQLDLSDLTEEEKKEHEVLFHTKLAIAKEPSGEGKDKQWKNVARGALWILKNKESGKALVRMRLPSGATPINFNILPRIASRVAGNSKTMILTSRPLPDGKITSMYLVVKTPEEAAQFSSVFDANMPQA